MTILSTILSIMYDWSESYTPSQAELLLWRFKFCGPGWYADPDGAPKPQGILLVIPEPHPTIADLYKFSYYSADPRPAIKAMLELEEHTTGKEEDKK